MQIWGEYRKSYNMIIYRPNVDFRLFYLISDKVSLIFMQPYDEIDVYICQCEQYCFALLIGKTEKILRWIHNAHNIGVFMPEFQEYSG